MKSINKTWALITCCVCLYGFAPLASAAIFDAYLRLDGLDGESTNPDYPGWIDVLSTEWSLDATATADKRGSGEISDIVIKTAADASSPYIALAAMTGRSFESAEFDFVDGNGQVVSTLRLSNVQIKSGTSTNQRDAEHTESWTLSYTKIHWTYYPVDREQAPSEFIWTRTGN